MEYSWIIFDINVDNIIIFFEIIITDYISRHQTKIVSKKWPVSEPVSVALSSIIEIYCMLHGLDIIFFHQNNGQMTKIGEPPIYLKTNNWINSTQNRRKITLVGE